MTPLERARAIARIAAFLAPVCAACGAAGCVTTHILSDADQARLQSSQALEGQMYKDLAPDASVPKEVLRAEAAGLYCSDTNVLVSALIADGPPRAAISPNVG